MFYFLQLYYPKIYILLSFNVLNYILNYILFLQLYYTKHIFDYMI